jgi:hypothetical protein
LEKDKDKQQQQDSDSSDEDKEEQKAKPAAATKPKPPVTGDGQQQQKSGKAGKGAAKAGAKAAAGKQRRLNDPEEDRRLAEANGITYIDQGSTRIDLDTGEIVLTETLVPKKFDYSVLKPDVCTLITNYYY